MNKIENKYTKNTHIKSKNNNIKSDNTTSSQSGFFCCCPHKLNDESSRKSQNSKNSRTNSMVMIGHYSDQIAENKERNNNSSAEKEKKVPFQVKKDPIKIPPQSLPSDDEGDKTIQNTFKSRKPVGSSSFKMAVIWEEASKKSRHRIESYEARSVSASSLQQQLGGKNS